MFIARMEQANFQRMGHEGYCASEITQAAFHLLENRTAQFYIVGFMAISLTFLKSLDQVPSLNRASIILSCAASEFGKITWAPALNPTQKEKLTSVTIDQASIRKIFRRYRSVAHVWAAHVASGEYLEPLHAWDRPTEVTWSVIKTAATYQQALENSVDTSTWDIWDLTRHFPRSLDDWPVLYPQDELLGWIETGYLQAVEEGLIKR